MNTRGIGLGLVISKQIVESFGGQIDFKSKFGRGSMFVFSFLLGRFDEANGPQKSAIQIQPSNQNKTSCQNTRI